EAERTAIEDAMDRAPYVALRTELPARVGAARTELVAGLCARLEGVRGGIRVEQEAGWCEHTLSSLVFGAIAGFVGAFLVYLVVLGPIVALTRLTMERARPLAYLAGVVIYVGYVAFPTVEWILRRRRLEKRATITRVIASWEARLSPSGR